MIYRVGPSCPIVVRSSSIYTNSTECAFEHAFNCTVFENEVISGWNGLIKPVVSMFSTKNVKIIEWIGIKELIRPFFLVYLDIVIYFTDGLVSKTIWWISKALHVNSTSVKAESNAKTLKQNITQKAHFSTLLRHIL